ncbi:hypothetical protein [Janthinobacterium psychrotolerans]|uniref:Uncharacterized protein n=1 Tax=Janthinobacterium psychrotolerans TaxID=1747903 RepID=A0A1A7C9G5_9BURK|nr:hypothetical protein [Janthinobacterium psychrotolerans]OBV41649.1 hypothetical protein ASR47_10409 [Janthinobacterium psychrotolerans]
MEKTRQEICIAALSAANNARKDESGAEAMTLMQSELEARAAYKEREKALEGVRLYSSEQAEALRLARKAITAAEEQRSAASMRRHQTAARAYMAQQEADAIAAIIPTAPAARRLGGRL